MQVPEVSVIVPCRDEADNLAFLIDEITTAMNGWTFEVIVVDDGSSDRTPAMVAEMAAERPWLRLLRHSESAGQSCAIRSGVHAANGAILATIDGDGQNDPAYLPALAEALKASGANVGLAAGQR
ncbi:MAG: glycosyltransferase family 2 protein, partial [Hyphomicrobiales bacterium]|nr:glycosyltransferase family 2 protein [Hyphomicrobiales bacterium]